MVTLWDYSMWRVSPHPQLWRECVWSVGSNTFKWVRWQLNLSPEKGTYSNKRNVSHYNQNIRTSVSASPGKDRKLNKKIFEDMTRIKRKLKRRNWEGKTFSVCSTARILSLVNNLHCSSLTSALHLLRSNMVLSIQCPNTHQKACLFWKENVLVLMEGQDEKHF